MGMVKLEVLREIEERGRALASDRDAPISKQHFEWLYDVKKKGEESAYAYFVTGKGQDKRYEALSFYVAEAADALLDDIRRCHLATALPEEKKLKDCKVTEKFKDWQETADTMCKSLFNVRCSYLLGVKEPYVASAAINDLTATYHRLLDKIVALEGKFEQKGLCKIDVDGDMTEPCMAWSVAADKLNRHGLYSPEDFNELAGYVTGHFAEFRVGSATGHKTHMDIKEGTLEYHDDDSPVNNVMKGLWEYVGLECDLSGDTEGWADEPSSDGVQCTGLTKENAVNAAKVMAAATSMDYRLANPDEWRPEVWNLAKPPAAYKLEELWKAVAKTYDEEDWIKGWMKELDKMYVSDIDALSGKVKQELEHKIEELNDLMRDAIERIEDERSRMKEDEHLARDELMEDIQKFELDQVSEMIFGGKKVFGGKKW